MKSKVMVLKDYKQPLVLEEFDIPELEDGQMLVKIEAAGVCGSDVHIWHGEDPRAPVPIILGHEGVGRIVKMNGVKKSVQGEDLKEGDLILWNRGVSCGKCFYCTVLKEPSLCPSRKVYGLNRSCDIKPFLNGCYSEYMILIEGTDIFKVTENIDPAVLVTASCSGATTCHGFDMHRPNVGDTVVVQGSGPIGLYAVILSKLSGASNIIVIGGPKERLRLCEEFGATRIINMHEYSIEERKEIIMEMTYGRGADFVVEAVGYPDALLEGLGLTRIGATYLSIGFGQPMGTIPFDGFEHLERKNLKIQGTWVSDTRHTYQAMELVLSNKGLFSKMVTHRFKLGDANDALNVMDNKTALKAVLIP